ncbi:uncharacterized protein LOC121738097 [Aricia agestis]|uniref:uncharacterized protein LOC121738097 n=1 Tax=Aricia agestis TaxID=91739 RepID=UPI001C207399|nr:uncharacterized protein LOC121738097 [Aricia agestis]
MQLPETPPPPLAPLWDRVLRARALPPDIDVQLLYVAIKDRLTHPEWEVRLHALRVLADLLPLSGNALSFPFDQVVDNLGHNSPNVRKAALDALKVFCSYCEDPECASRAILDKFSYSNIRPFSSDMDTKINVVTGLILSIPSVIGILKRRNQSLDVFPIFHILGEKLFDNVHKDVALRSLLKLRRVCGPHLFTALFSKLNLKTQDKFRYLCEVYDEDSLDVYYAPRKTHNQPVVQLNRTYNGTLSQPINISTDSSSEESIVMPYYKNNNNNNYGKVIIETEIKFDSDTAITMTVLEQNDTESDKYYTGSEEDFDHGERDMLRYSEGDSDEDSDVVVKKVRFGGESVKIRTPDSENLLTSEDDGNQNKPLALLDKSAQVDNTQENSTVSTKQVKAIEPKQEPNKQIAKELRTAKKSGIPLPVINNKVKETTSTVTKFNQFKFKSKSLSELYDFFNKKNNNFDSKHIKSDFALTLTEVRTPDKVPSPVEPHREVEVLHNLQRSPTLSPRRQHTIVSVERDGFLVNLVSSHTNDLVSPRPPVPLRERYDWEMLGLVPAHTIDQLHNTENWIAAVKAADQVHNVLLSPENVTRIEPVADTFVQHMFALSDAVPAARAPAEGAICALVRSTSADCVRHLLPLLIARIAREPSPAAIPHALLQRMALHHVVELIFEEDLLGVSDKEQRRNAQLQAALCLARAAGPAAVLAAVRRRLSGSPEADTFCNKLRERLNRPVENIRPSHVARASQLPVSVRRRARSTPPNAPIPLPRRLRPLPDSAPLPGTTPPGRNFVPRPLSPIPLNGRESSLSEKEAAPKHVIEAEDVNYDVEPETKLPDEPVPPRTPSIHIEDVSEKFNPSIHSSQTIEGSTRSAASSENLSNHRPDTPDAPVEVESQTKSEKASPAVSVSSKDTKSLVSQDTVQLESEPETPERVCVRDVRTAISECIAPAKHEDWETTLGGLLELERLASDGGAHAPAASWRAAARSTTLHVRSLRSRVARAACSTLGTLFERRGKVLDPELEEAAQALLDRCADVNRFLRADATAALGRVACGGGYVRAGVALARRGASHRAGPVRAAAAQALARLVKQQGAARVLELPGEPRVLVLRAVGELLADANADTRLHARHLCLALAEDHRFEPLLKEAMAPSRYRAIEKFVDKLRCR